MSEEDYKIIYFIIKCINEFTERFNLNYKSTFEYFKQYEIIIFLKEQYNYESKLSIDEIINDIIVIFKDNGVSLV